MGRREVNGAKRRRPWASRVLHSRVVLAVLPMTVLVGMLLVDSTPTSANTAYPKRHVLGTGVAGNGRVAFQSTRDGHAQIYTMHLDGLDTKTLQAVRGEVAESPAAESMLRVPARLRALVRLRAAQHGDPERALPVRL